MLILNFLPWLTSHLLNYQRMRMTGPRLRDCHQVNVEFIATISETLSQMIPDIKDRDIAAVSGITSLVT